jgi:glycosyltransferase involved in cell wall biosynthesis
LGLGDRVRFTGYVAQEDLPGLYSGARLFAYPSRYEGFGLPVLEAMRCGVPVVTTNVSSMPEVAGDAALLVSPDDEIALAEAMTRLVADPALAADLGRRGRERAALFSWERCARETREVYQRVLGERNGGAR